MKKILTTRIFKNPVSSIVGGALIGGALYTAVRGVYGWSEVMIPIVAGLGLLGIKDPFQKSNAPAQ